MSSRRLQDMSSRCLQNMSSRRLQHCYAEDVLKASSRPTNVCWVQSKHKKLFLTSKNEEPITTLSEKGTSLITGDSALSG